MPIIPALSGTRSTGGVVKASWDHTDFTNIRDTVNTYALLTDVARTVTVTHTYTLTQTFTGGWTAAAACTISTGGLTVTAGGATLTAGDLTMGAAVSRLIPGATSFAVRNTANTLDNLLVTDAGDVTVRNNLTVTGTFSPASLSVSATVTLTGAAGIGTPVLNFNGGANQFIRLDGTNTVGWATSDNAKQYLSMSSAGVTIGALAVSTQVGPTTLALAAVIGHVKIPTTAGTPTGVPEIGNGAIQGDTTGTKFWIYLGGWKFVAVA